MPLISMIVIVLCLVSLQKYIYKKYWFKNLDLKISFSKNAIFEGENLQLIEIISNKKILPIPFIAVKFQVSKNLIFSDSTNAAISDDYYRNDIFSILSYQKITRNLQFNGCKRGFYTIKNAELVSNNLLFDNKLQVAIDMSAYLTVYPKITNIDSLSIPLNKIQGDILTKRFINEDPFTFKGIREYTMGDSFKSINFKASAKTNEFMVNINDYTISQEIIILLNLQSYNIWSSHDLFEEAIRLAASISHFYIHQGIPLGIICGEDLNIKSSLTQEHLFSIYDSLANIDLDKPTEPISEFLSDFTPNAYNNSVFILISTYHEKDLQETFYNLTNSGTELLWLLPAFKDMPLNIDFSDKIIHWQV